MAKTNYIPRLLLLIALCFSCQFSGGFLRAQEASARATSTSSELRSAVIQVARAEIGVKEYSGRNDGERVGKYLRYTGLGEGYEWCAAFVSWCFGQLGLPEPNTPWSPSLFPSSRRLPSVAYARPGDVFGIWVREKGRVGHVGLVEEVLGVGGRSSYFITIEGNYQDAVRRVRRPISSIFVVADWISRKGGEL